MTSAGAAHMSNEDYFRCLDRGAVATRAADVRRIRLQVSERWRGDPRADELAEALGAHEKRLSARATTQAVSDTTPAVPKTLSAPFADVLADETLTPEERLRLAECLFIPDAEWAAGIHSAGTTPSPARAASRIFARLSAGLGAVAAGIALAMFSRRRLRLAVPC